MNSCVQPVGHPRPHRIWLHTVCDLIYCGNGHRLGAAAGGAQTFCPATARKRNMTLIGVPRETAAGERRVALVPKVVERLRAAGLAVVVETGAGTGALIPDEQYEQAGATIGDPWPADLVVKVNPPTADEIGLLKPESTIVGFLAPRTRPEVAEGLRLAGVTGYAMEAIPRISRAQTMDALSSQANVAGDKAVLVAAAEATRFFPMLTTAAGTVKPASVVVLGVGGGGGGDEAGQCGGRSGRRDRRQLRADRARSDRHPPRRHDRLAAEPACHHARACQRVVFEEHHRAAGPVDQRRRAGAGFRRRRDRAVLRHTRRGRRRKLRAGDSENV